MPTLLLVNLLVLYHRKHIFLTFFHSFFIIFGIINIGDDKMNQYIKNAGKGLLVIFIYFAMSAFQTLPFALLGVDISAAPQFLRVIYLIAYELLMISFMIIIFRDRLTEKWIDFKKNHRIYFKKYFKYWFLLLGLMMISNAAIMTLTNDISGADNQNAIIDMFGNAPFYTYLSAVVFAPIVEELVFRESIRMIIPKYNILFILVSGFIFGGMHVLGAPNLEQFLYIIPYSIPGLIFAYVLAKSDNIFNTIGLHFVHNGILMAVQVLVLLLG